jgi:hypothetical protein
MKCKQGDLAFIKKALRYENIGKVVTCARYLGYYERGSKVTISGEEWLAFDSDNYWLVKGDIETMFGKARESYIPDTWLAPISPLPPKESNNTDTPLIIDLELAE